MSGRDLPPQPPYLREWNSTGRSVATGPTIAGLLDAAAAAHSGKPAVIGHDGRMLSHEQLAARSIKLAADLARLGVLARTPVGVLLDHVPEAIIGLHAIVRSRALYVPIDRRWPLPRIRYTMAKLGIKTVLATSDYLGIACDAARELRVVQLHPDGSSSVVRGSYDELRPANPGHPMAGDLAYAIFTSGSTGEPKAVAVRHASVVNLIDWFNRRNQVGPGDRLLQVAPFCFDLSVYDVFGVAAAGASICLIPDAVLEEPEEVAAVLAACDATLWNSAPAMFTATTEFLEPPAGAITCAAMRRVFLSGDWIPLATPDRVRRIFPNAALVSLGGATEACVWSNDFVVGNVDPCWKSIPYGHPMQNARYYVLGGDLAPCAVDEPGELYIAGACVSAGYLGAPALTTERFLPDPWDPDGTSMMYRTGDRARWTSDGWVEFLGRVDSQVKIRGYRIELEEIEHAARQVPGVLEAIALAVGGPLAPLLVLAVRGTAAVTVPMIRDSLAGWLPDYMRPSKIRIFSSFPVGATGKVDRRELSTLFS